MTRIDFYLLADQTEEARLKLACRLAEKIHRLGKDLYIHATNEDQSRRVDRLLWVYRDNSFLPHSLLGEQGDIPKELPYILIGYGQSPPLDRDIMINLSMETSPFFSRFDRVAEIVDESPENRLAGRNRYRFYQQRGYPLKIHKISLTR